MRLTPIPTIVTLAVLLTGWSALAAQDRSTLKVPDGLSLAEFKGYETWETVAVSQTKEDIKAIAANPEMIKAFKQGLPATGKTFPEGSRIVKLEWTPKENKVSPYPVTVPGKLDAIALIVKDSKRFPKTHGWAYALFKADPVTGELKPDGKGTECGYACHTKVAAQDYIYTAYPPR
jgi:hypothetical protein